MLQWSHQLNCTMGTIEVDDEEYVAYVNDLILEVR